VASNPEISEFEELTMLFLLSLIRGLLPSDTTHKIISEFAGTLTMLSVIDPEMEFSPARPVNFTIPGTLFEVVCVKKSNQFAPDIVQSLGRPSTIPKATSMVFLTKESPIF